MEEKWSDMGFWKRVDLVAGAAIGLVFYAVCWGLFTLLALCGTWAFLKYLWNLG